MNIDAIKNGIVIDHIHAGGAMELYRLLNLDKLDCTVAIIKNAPSELMGRKDIIKIDSMTDIDLDGHRLRRPRRDDKRHQGRPASLKSASSPCRRR